MFLANLEKKINPSVLKTAMTTSTKPLTKVMAGFTTVKANTALPITSKMVLGNSTMT